MPDDLSPTALQSRETVAEIIAAARALAPKLAERAQEGNEQRRAPDATIADYDAAGFVRLCQPRRFGGKEQPFSAISDLVMALGRGDGSQAWVADVYCEHTYMLSLFPDQAQHDVWDENPGAMISASIVPLPQNSARKVDGGYVLNGRWPFLSGLYHSHWSMLGHIIQVDGAPRHHFFLVPAKDRALVDDWHVLGLAGTGSASIDIKDVFVPDHRILMNASAMAGDAPGAKVNTNPIYRMPVFGYTLNGLGSVTTGILQGMVGDFTKFVAAAASRPHPPPGLATLTERAAEAAMEAEVCMTMLRKANRRLDAILCAGERLSDEDATLNTRTVSWVNMVARRAATRMFEVSGAHGLLLPGPLQRAFRDIYAAGVHRALNWDAAAVRYGKMITGQRLDPPHFQ